MLLAPIAPAITQGKHKCESGRDPDLQARERERGREIKCDGKHRRAHDVRSGEIQVVDQEVADNPANQAFHGDHAKPANVSGKQCKKRGHKYQEPETAQALRHRRLHLARAEPASAQQGREHWEQKSSHAEGLQTQVREDRAHDADPVARSPHSRQHRSAVERGVKWGVGRERKEKEERGDTQQEADQFVQPPVAGRIENARKSLHLGVFRTRGYV